MRASRVRFVVAGFGAFILFLDRGVSVFAGYLGLSIEKFLVWLEFFFEESI